MTSDILNEILKLKKEKNAAILAHYYAPDEIQSVADYVGDSFYLARLAENIPEKLIVFCGVGFMAESVKIINPEKTVLVPDMSADCAMAHMASVEKIKEMREKYDDLAVVCYINSTAELKCNSDICVTSSNAVKIVKNLPNKNIFFIPDKNLGTYVAEQVPEKNIILNDGYCPIHASLGVEVLKKTIEKHPNAKVLTHPECEKEILALSDFIGSTADILKYAGESEHNEFVVCTEEGVGYPLKKNNPDKKFYFAGEDFICGDMKLNTPEKLLNVLKTGENEIKVSKTKREKALHPLKRMLDSAK